MEPITNVLAIEDDPGDVELLRRYLLDTPDLKWQVADRLSTGLKAISDNQVDLVLLDLGLPDSQGMETLVRFRSQFPDTPVVVLTTLNEEAAGLAAVRMGAQDYLIKGNVNRVAVSRSIHYAIQRHATQKALEKSEALLKEAQRVAHIGHWEIDSPDGTPTWSEEIFRIFGLDPALGEPSFAAHRDIIHPDDWELLKGSVTRACAHRIPFCIQFRVIRPDKSIRWVEAKGHATGAAQSGTSGLFGTAQDITERKQTEEALSRSLERQGRLNQVQQALLGPGELIGKLKLITESVVDIFGADFCRIWRIGPGDLCESGCMHAAVTEGPHVCLDKGRCLKLLVSSGRYAHTDGVSHRRVPFGAYEIGRLASGEEHEFLINDVVNDPRVHNREWARELGLTSFAGYQLRPPGGETLGVLALFSKNAITPTEDVQLDALSSATAQVFRSAEDEEALKESEKRMRLIIDSAPIGIRVAQDAKYVYVNPAFVRMFGYDTEAEIVDLPVEAVVAPESKRSIRQRWADRMAGKRVPEHYEVTSIKKDGSPFDVEGWDTEIIYMGKRSWLAFILDVSEAKTLRSQLFQAQKMEAIGTLAGGIAHDFNNLLQVVLGYSELVLAHEGLPQRLRNDLEKILLAGKTGTDLVQRLLTFSRKTEIRPLDLDINQRIQQTQKFLQRTIPKMIDIQLILAQDLGVVHADPTQVDQVLMNLAVNARDAMPEGGKLVIETSNVVIDEDYARSHLEAKPGGYVLLRVSDTGLGMDKETMEHIFEPFYTTKAPGQGTGLGLAMVFGIVKQHHGFINCYSEVGRGTRFSIYLPTVIPGPQSDEPVATVMVQGGTETILLVDDEEFLRDLGKRILERSGYTVMTATNGKEALDVYQARRAEIALVILDLIMPEMGGKQCLEELLKTDSKARILIASGFAAEGRTKEAIETGAKGFVRKPYNINEILRAVRDVLDSE
jgi:two-component system, cell cycle sensor histidine kinase and response regulator CckA